jgi:hypothetical protein
LDERFSTAMSDSPVEHSSPRGWRLALPLLIVLPFLPEIGIYATAALASVQGCQLEQKSPCALLGTQASDLIAASLDIALARGAIFGAGGAAVWLAACYFVLSRGWSRIASRLSLGLLATVIFAVLPYFGPMLAISGLVNSFCHPNEGGVGSCQMYGGEVGDPAHETVTLPWFMFIGAPMAFGALLIYAIVLIVLRMVAARRTATSAR